MANMYQPLTAEDKQGWLEIDDKNENLYFTGNWTNYTDASCYGGSEYVSTSNVTTSYIFFKGYFDKIRLLDFTGSNRCSAVSIIIDNDTYTFNPSDKAGVYQALIYENLNLNLAWHTVSIVGASSDGVFGVDEILLYATDSTPQIKKSMCFSGATLEEGYNRYNCTYMNLVYKDGWGYFTNSGAYMGGWMHKQNSTTYPTSEMEFCFYGTSFKIGSMKNSGRSGAIKIFIDGELQTVRCDQYSKSSYYQIITYERCNLPVGVHKVRFLNDETSRWCDIDFVDVDGYMCDKDGKYIDITPTMTSNTTPSPYVASSSGTYSTAYKEYFAFDGVGVNSKSSANTYACTKNADAFHLILDFGKETLFDSFKICTRTNSEPDGYPKVFSILGSHDGITWDVLGNFDKSDWEMAKEYMFKLDKAGKYRFAKLDCTEIICFNTNAKFATITQLRYMLDSDTKFFLLKVGDKYNNYDEETNSLVDIVDLSILNVPITENTCIYDLEDAIDLLPSLENVKLIGNKNTNIELKAIKHKSEMFVMRTDTFTNQVDYINKIFTNCNVSGRGSIKLVVSTDSGLTWKTYNDGWKNIAITIPQGKYSNLTQEEKVLWESAKNEIMANGIDSATIDTLDFDSLNAEKLRFAVSLSVNDYSDVARLKSIMWNIKMNSYLKECDETEVEKMVIGNSVKLHSNIETSKLKVNILTAGITAGGAFDYNSAENKPVFNGVTFEGVLSSDDVGVASKASVDNLTARIDAITGDRQEYKGYFATEADRDTVITSPEEGDYCVVDSSTSEDANYTGKTIKYTYQQGSWQVYMIVPTGQVEIDDGNKSSDKTWSSNQISDELDKKQNIKGKYSATVDASQLVLEESGEYEGFYKVSITHSLGCSDSFNLNVLNASGQSFRMGVFFDNIQANGFDLYSITKQSLNITIEEV